MGVRRQPLPQPASNLQHTAGPGRKLHDSVPGQGPPSALAGGGISESSRLFRDPARRLAGTARRHVPGDFFGSGIGAVVAVLRSTFRRGQQNTRLGNGA